MGNHGQHPFHTGSQEQGSRDLEQGVTDSDQLCRVCAHSFCLGNYGIKGTGLNQKQVHQIVDVSKTYQHDGLDTAVAQTCCQRTSEGAVFSQTFGSSKSTCQFEKTSGKRQYQNI